MNVRVRGLAKWFGIASAGCFLTWLVLSTSWAQNVGHAPPQAQQPNRPARPAPAQEYAGTLKCAACHYQAYRMWQDTAHAKAFEILPAKYRNDRSCLRCHSTGPHQPPADQGDAAKIAGVTCEACHGAGAEHFKIASGYLGKEIKPVDAELIRNSIEKLLSNVCLDCHLTAVHKAHPPFDRE